MPTQDDDDVGSLLAERGPALAGYAYLLCGNRQDAEDLVQEALVRTCARRRAGLELDSPEAYVRRTIRALLVDGWRRRGRWMGRRHLAAGRAWTEGPEATAGDRLDVGAALRRLPPQQRACVVLRFYDDLTVHDIAVHLGVSDGSVKRSISVGVHRLETLLAPVAPEREPADAP